MIDARQRKMFRRAAAPVSRDRFAEYAIQAVAELGRLLASTGGDSDPAARDGRCSVISTELREAGRRLGFDSIAVAAARLERALAGAGPQGEIESLALELCRAVDAAGDEAVSPDSAVSVSRSV
jgi:hypothetical protein